MVAYDFFVSEFKQVLQQQYPSITGDKLQSAIEKQWKSLSKKLKGPFESMANGRKGEKAKGRKSERPKGWKDGRIERQREDMIKERKKAKWRKGQEINRRKDKKGRSGERMIYRRKRNGEE